MKVLGDGTVLPSSFNTAPMPDARHFLHNNMSLRAGAVVGIHYPDQDSSISKQVIEYDVAIFQADPRSGVNISIMRNCKVNNVFGAPNNSLNYTLVSGKRDENGVYSKSSLVLVLCINGLSDVGSAIIVGGIDSPNGPAYTSADGQFYDFNFNGINYNINNDGELSITFNSPIDVDGNKANADAAGTELKIDKEGRIKISDNEGQFWELDRVAKTSTWSNGNESIVIDEGNKSIAVTSSGTLSTESTQATSMDSADAMSMSSKADMSMSSDANSNMSAKGNMAQKSGGVWQVQATGDVNVKAGGNVNIQGGSQAQLNAAVTLLGEGTAAVAVVGVSIVLGTGNLGLPVVSQILTGSRTVFAGT